MSVSDSEFNFNRPGDLRAAAGAPSIKPALAGDRISLRSPAEALEPVAAPPPPRRSRQARSGIVVVLNAVVSVMVFAAVFGCGAVYFGKLRFEEPGPLVETRTVVIKEGSGLKRISEQLRQAGVIDGDWMFRLGVSAYGSAGRLKPGEYAFKPGMSMYDVMDDIRNDRGVTYKITFPEGLTVRQFFDRLSQNGVLEGALPADLPAEGTLLPDTYSFKRGTTRMEIVGQTQKAQQQLLETIWSRRIAGLPVKSLQEFVTLASIVEKETGRADERPRVAAVFINRLKKGMRLQSDPTIIYGLFGGEGKPEDRPILKTDIERPSPYNTYLIDGLPPGPIANPGRAALEAVANPSRTEELYFVADGTGGHAFAISLGEHEENVKKWRVVEKRLKEEAEKKAAKGNAPDDSVRSENEEEVDPADPVSQ